MSKLDLFELEESNFEPSRSEAPEVVNPDAWIRRIYAGRLRWSAARKMRRTPVLCISCLTGKHAKCEKGGCPCVHLSLTSDSA